MAVIRGSLPAGDHVDYQPPFNRTVAIDNLCMEIAELVGSLHPTSELSTNPTLHREIRISTIHSSLVIEGNHLTCDAVTAIIDGKRVLGPAKDILEVENARKAYEMLDELNPLSIDDLLRAHGVMMQGLISDAGLFRSGNVGVFDGENLVHAGTPARYVPEVISELFEWMRSTDLHPLLVSCLFHFEFEFIHPFSDGNGRTGRLWHTFLLSKWRPVLAWLPLESVILGRQRDYYRALAESDAAGSCEQFVEFMLAAIRDALLPYAKQDGAPNERENRALSFFERNPKGTVDDLAQVLGCSKRSAERVVAQLRRAGRLKREGSARSGTWVIAGK